MKRIRQSLREEVFTIFVRACDEAEFGLADHLLGAIEFIALLEEHPEQVDLAYLLLASSCDDHSKKLPSNAVRHSKPNRPATKAGSQLGLLATSHRPVHRQKRRAP